MTYLGGTFQCTVANRQRGVKAVRSGSSVMDQLTTPAYVVIISNMKAVAIMNERHVIAEGAFVEMVVWQVGQPLRESPHRLKYRLALVVAGECILRYDNEAGKGDHRHVGNVETQFAFRSYEQLLTDFWADVDEWRRQNENGHA